MSTNGIDLTAWAVANYENLESLTPDAQDLFDDLFVETEQAFTMETLHKAWSVVGPPPSGLGDGWEDDDMDLWFDRMYTFLAGY